MAAQGGQGGCVGACPEVLLWHDLIHESQDLSRLHFWRLSFSPSYDSEAIFERLHSAFVERSIESYAIYQTLGAWDLLLRVWVPREQSAEEIQAHLDRALQHLKIWNIDWISCHTVSHWADGDTNPSLWPDLDDPVVGEVSRFNDKQMRGETVERSERMQELVAEGVLKVIPTDTKGVRLFVVFDHPRFPFNPGGRRQALSRLRQACEEVSAIWSTSLGEDETPRISIYEGSGTMTEFLVMARAPHGHFHSFVSDLGSRLRQAGLDDLYDMRSYTHVIADRMFSRFAENRPSSKAEPQPEIGIELEETESLEYKASFSLDVRRYLETGEQAIDPRLIHATVRAVCGLLNSPRGGRLVIGVLEVRRMLERTKDKLKLLQSMSEKFGYEIEQAELLAPPNALIGIEAEVGEEKNFKDLDAYQRRVGEVLRDQITPNPWSFMELSFSERDERSLCVIEVRPGNEWFWGLSADGGHEEFYVREAGATRAYSGVESDLYKKANPRN